MPASREAGQMQDQLPPRQPAKYDIQPGTPFQPGRINNRIGKRTEKDVQCRHRVECERGRYNCEPEHQPDYHQPLATVLEKTVYKRSILGTRHFCVDVALEVLVKV